VVESLDAAAVDPAFIDVVVAVQRMLTIDHLIEESQRLVLSALSTCPGPTHIAVFAGVATTLATLT
jgi:hypothetical protein